MKAINIKCPQCHAYLEIDSDLESPTCEYCGAKILLDDEATKIHRIEKAKLESRKSNHEQALQEKKDKDKYEYLKRKKDMKIGLIAIVCMFGFVPLIAGINWIFTGYFAMPGYKPNPSLAQFNSLNLGMSYTECKEILGEDGHLIEETEIDNVYIWYDNDCFSEDDSCQEIIRLEFKEGKLVSRKENGLK